MVRLRGAGDRSAGGEMEMEGPASAEGLGLERRSRGGGGRQGRKAVLDGVVKSGQGLAGNGTVISHGAGCNSSGSGMLNARVSNGEEEDWEKEGQEEDTKHEEGRARIQESAFPIRRPTHGTVTKRQSQQVE